MTDQVPLNTFELERSIPFGYCDPAGIIYTPRALDICLEAIDDFWKSILDGTGWYEMNIDLDRGTPFVNVNIDFKSPITARAPLQVKVEVIKLGKSSATFQITAVQQERTCFVAQLTSVIVVKSEMAPVDVSDWVRKALGMACGEATV